MSIRITSQESKVALFDSTTDYAFGPVFDDELEAELFVQWYQATHGDPRTDYFKSLAGMQTFWQHYADWRRAVTDPVTHEFRLDIADNMLNR